MYKSIYITATEPRTGKSLFSLGIVEWLLRLTPRVAVFRPIINDNPEGGRDPNIDLLLRYFKLNVPYEDTYVFEASEAIDLLARRESEELINRVIHQLETLLRDQLLDRFLADGKPQAFDEMVEAVLLREKSPHQAVIDALGS